MGKILQWDYQLFERIHSGLANDFFDFLLPFCRDKYFWAPVYLFVAILVYERAGKKSLVWILGLIATFALSDFISASFLKPIFHRTRPCNDSMWHDVYRNIVKRSRGYSFPSTHATNHFAISTYIYLTLGHLNKKIFWLALGWAILVGFAQIYVGVHYPSDILAGAMLGMWIGYIVGNYSKYNTEIC